MTEIKMIILLIVMVKKLNFLHRQDNTVLNMRNVSIIYLSKPMGILMAVDDNSNKTGFIDWWNWVL